MSAAHRLRVAIRADASAQIGLGHVVRSLAVAQALRELDVDVVLLAADLGLDLSNRIAAAGVEYIGLAPAAPASATFDSAGDAARTIAALGAWSPDLVLVDHYGIDARWHGAVRASLKVLLAVIDDLAERDLAADWLIDPNLCPDPATKYAGRLLAPAVKLIGPRFALLAPVYRHAMPAARAATVHSIGIFMGGTDPLGASATVLRACRAVADFTGPIEIAVHSGNPALPELRAACAASPGTELLVDAENLCAFFGRHELHVGAGGGATWERCRMGAPTLALVCASNQAGVIPPLAALGIVATLPELSAVESEAIGRTIRSLLDDAERRQEMSVRSRALVDGLGAMRVALSLAAGTLTVRRALADDGRRLHAWRNHPATRRLSGDDAEIAWDTHRRWLGAALADPDRTLLVASIASTPIGSIRFDRAQSEATVSLYLDPALHGLGLGGAMLGAGERFMAANSRPPSRIVATVLEANISSKRMFAAAGYRAIGAQWRKELSHQPGVAR